MSVAQVSQQNRSIVDHQRNKEAKYETKLNKLNTYNVKVNLSLMTNVN